MITWGIRKIFKLVWFSLVTVFFIWNWYTFQSRNLPDNTFENNAQITVSKDDDKISFTPRDTASNLQVIFFQGGLTDPKAYGPLCRRIAEHGFTCHLIKMSWRLPQFDYKKISKLFDLSNGRYAIGGHSQGAKMAAQFVYENPRLMAGLFLLGTSHPRDVDLSELGLPTLKIYGTRDGLASIDEVIENKDKLPQEAKLISIEGGNHSQFGYLGNLLMDDDASISLEAQQEQTMREMIQFLTDISNK